MLFRPALAAVFTLLVLAGPLLAADQDSAAPSTTVESIAKWVEELDSDNFDVRQRATRQLIKAGVEAIPAVSKAAETGSLEATSRAVSVLAELFKSKDAATKTAAEAALKKLTASKNEAAKRRAGEILKPNAPKQPAQGGIQIFGGGNGPFQDPTSQCQRQRAEENSGQRKRQKDHDRRAGRQQIKVTVTGEGRRERADQDVHRKNAPS